MSTDRTRVKKPAVNVPDERSVVELERSEYGASSHLDISNPSTFGQPAEYKNTGKYPASRPNIDGLKRISLLLIGDVVAVLVCSAFSWSLSVVFRYLLSADALDSQVLTRQLSIEVFFLIPLGVIVSFSIYWGHYTQGKPFWSEQLQIIKASVFAIIVGLAFLYLSKQHVSRLWLISLWLCLTVCIPFVRASLKKLMINQGFWYRPMIVIGTGKNAEAAAAMLKSEPMLGYKILSFIDIGLHSEDTELLNGKTVHGLSTKLDIQNKFGSVDVLFAMDTLEEIDKQKTLIEDFICSSSARMMVAPPLNGLPLYGADIINVFKHDNLFLNVRNNLGSLRHKLTKRVFDVVVSFCLLLLLSPLLVIVYFIIALDGGPGVYASKRVGYGGVIFNCFKLRSMAVDSENILAELLRRDPQIREEWNREFKLEHDPRVTKIGRFIRKTSLDELPQLWNVLIGNMSLIGPRPILPDELEQYGENIKYYMITRPGITGLWQVSGRNNLTYNQRIELNLWYTKNWSLWNDIIILLKTIPIATKGGGAY